MNKKVSVIIPVYNCENYIKQCIYSVINQTYKNLEIIIINDGSTDKSMEFINRLNDERIIVINLENNKGVGYSRNQGIDRATGDYICFIDSDDVWIEDKIEKQVKYISENNYEFIYSDYIYMNTEELKNIDDYKRVIVPKEINYEQAIKNTTIFISTVMLDAKKVKKEDMYMPNMSIGQDTAVWWHILKSGIIAHGINEVMAGYRVSIKSLSSNKLKAVIGAWKLYKREIPKIGKRMICYTNYLKNAIKRRV